MRLTVMTDTNKKQSKFALIWGKIVKYGLPMLISVGLCYVLFHDMDFAEMAAFVKSDCDFRLILVAMALGALAFVIRALRWRIQLSSSQIYAPVMPVIYSIAGTYAVNLIFPRLGEVWRSDYIARRQKAPFATVFGSMVADRAADTITVLLLCLLAFFIGGSALRSFFDNKFEFSGILFQLISSPWTYVVGALLLIICIALLRVYRHKPLVPKIIGIGRQLLSGFMSIFHIERIWAWLLLTIMLWGTYFVQMWVCFSAFGMTQELMQTHGLIIVFVCFVFGCISMGVPSNGGIGPYQIAVVFGLECFAAGIDKQQAYAFANVVLGAETLVTILCGILTFIMIAIDNRTNKS